MEINEDNLYDELLEVRRKLIRNQSTNNIRKYYPVFEQLNYTLAQITGFAIDPKDMLCRNVDELNDDIRLQNKKQILEYFNRAITEGDPLYFLFMSSKLASITTFFEVILPRLKLPITSLSSLSDELFVPSLIMESTVLIL